VLLCMKGHTLASVCETRPVLKEWNPCTFNLTRARSGKHPRILEVAFVTEAWQRQREPPSGLRSLEPWPSEHSYHRAGKTNALH